MPLDRARPTLPGLRSSRLRRRGVTALMRAAARRPPRRGALPPRGQGGRRCREQMMARGLGRRVPRAGTEVLDLWMVFLKSGHKKMYCRGEIHVNPKCLQSNVGHAMGHDFVRRTLHLSFKVELLSLSKSQRSITNVDGCTFCWFSKCRIFLKSQVLCLLKTKLDCIATERNFDSLL